MLIFVLFWLVLFGSAIGSFLNVVIYRFPTGLSLLFPPSHCPKCKHPIRWYDNVPVLGWIMLRGKCRDCGEPISFRYPMIEAICGWFFGFVGFVLLQNEFNEGIPSPDFESIFILVVYNSLLFTTLLAAGMIEYDRKIAPAKLFVPILFFGFLISWDYRQQHPIPFFETRSLNRTLQQSEPQSQVNVWRGGIDALVGAFGAAFFTCLIFPLFPKEDRKTIFSGVLCANIAAGLSFGWQFSFFAAIGILILLLLSRISKLRALPGLSLLVFSIAWFAIVY